MKGDVYKKLKETILNDNETKRGRWDGEEKLAWIVERAEHYAEKLSKTPEEILEKWESKRDYWWPNYYQEANFPLLTSDSVMLYEDWIAELEKRFGKDSKKWTFVCPQCGNQQCGQDFLDHKIESPENKVYYSCIGRYVEGKGCNWTLGGLFQIHKMSVVHDSRVIPVFEMAPAVELETKED